MYNKYPYTDFSELNLDWFLGQFKELMESWDAQKVDYEQFKLDVTTEFNTLSGKFDNLKDAFEDLQSYIENYFENLDVQQEINNKLDQMAQDGSLLALLEPIFDEFTEDTNDRMDVLEGRMDAFSSLTEGSTTGDAELMDIRVGANGITYPNAGDAVRGQVDELQDQIDDIDDLVEKTYYKPGFTELVDLPAGTQVTYSPSNTSQFITATFDNSPKMNFAINGTISANTRIGIGISENPTLLTAPAATSQLRFKISGDAQLTDTNNVYIAMGACSADGVAVQNWISVVTTHVFQRDKSDDGYYYMSSNDILGLITDPATTTNFYIMGVYLRTAVGQVDNKEITFEWDIASNSDLAAYGWEKPEYKNVVQVLDTKADKSDLMIAQEQSLVASNALRFEKHMDHLFSEGAAGNSVKVPFESVYHLRISKRLGFKVFEINVHTLSDGNYLAFHGSTSFGYPSFGNSVEHVDGTTVVNDIAFDTVSLDWVKQNIRYKCNYPKFRTAPSSLDEMLKECRILGMIPYVQLDASTFDEAKPEIDLIDSYMGKGNYILYIKPGGVADEVRAYTSAWFGCWKNLATAAQIEEFVDKYKPICYGMSNYDTFTDSDLKDIVDMIHRKGSLIISAYLTEVNYQRLMSLGFDFVSSSHQINYTNSGNICNLAGDLVFTDFSTNGTVTNAELTLTAGQSITVPETYDSIYLGGGTMQLVYDGDISLSMGSHINNVALSSDGSSVNVFTTYFFNERPSFTITAISTTKISLITFNASKF